MKEFWIKILKPKGKSAKWLIFLTIILLVGLGAAGHFDIARQYLDTELLTVKVGSYKISAYQALKSILVIALVFWTAAIITDIAEGRISKIRKLAFVI